MSCIAVSVNSRSASGATWRNSVPSGPLTVRTPSVVKSRYVVLSAPTGSRSSYSNSGTVAPSESRILPGSARACGPFERTTWPDVACITLGVGTLGRTGCGSLSLHKVRGQPLGGTFSEPSLKTVQDPRVPAGQLSHDPTLDPDPLHGPDRGPWSPERGHVHLPHGAPDVIAVKDRRPSRSPAGKKAES